MLTDRRKEPVHEVYLRSSAKEAMSPRLTEIASAIGLHRKWFSGTPCQNANVNSAICIQDLKGNVDLLRLRSKRA